MQLQVVAQVYSLLEPLDDEGRRRVLKWLMEILEIPVLSDWVELSNRVPAQLSVVDQEVPTPRDFISSKKPQSATERVACLAHYLTHYRDTPHFKTADIVALNVEAARHKFGNAPRDVDNTDRQNGYIVSAGKGAKQITVRGETLVEALPDREAVKIALREHPHRPRRSSNPARRVAEQTEEES